MDDLILDGEVVSDETTFTPDLSHIEFSAHPFGWCNDGNHGPNERTKGCPGIVGGTPWPDPAARHKFIPNPKKRCPCWCHRRDTLGD